LREKAIDDDEKQSPLVRFSFGRPIDMRDRAP